MRLKRLSNAQFLWASEQLPSCVMLKLKEPPQSLVDSPDLPCTFDLRMEILALINAYALLRDGYTHVSVTLESALATTRGGRPELPSGVDFEDLVNIFYSYTTAQSTQSGAGEKSNALFFKEYNLTSLIASSNFDATDRDSKPPPQTFSYDKLPSNAYDWTKEIIPDENERAKKITVGTESSKSLYTQMILESSDSLADLSSCEFPRSFDTHRMGTRVEIPEILNNTKINSEEKSSFFWKFWKKIYSHDHTSRLYNVETVNETINDPMVVADFRLSAPMLESEGSLLFSVDDLLELLKLEYKIHVQVYRDPNLPTTDQRSSIEILYQEWTGIRPIELLEYDVLRNCYAQPAKVSIENSANEFQDIAQVTNDNTENSILVRILEKYYDVSNSKIKNGNSALLRVNPLGENTAEFNFNSSHTIRWYEAYQIPYVIKDRNYPLLIPLVVNRKKPTPAEINNSRIPFAYCNYYSGNINIVGKNFPPDTEQYRFYLDESSKISQRPCGSYRGKYSLLQTLYGGGSNFSLGIRLNSLPPGSYKIIIDAVKNDCVVQTYDSVFSVRDTISEQSNASFVLSATTSKDDDTISITETSTAENISNLILETANPLFSEFFSEGFAKTSPKSQIATAYKIYRLDHVNGAYEDVTPGSTGYVPAGAYTIESPSISEDDSKNVQYFVDQYATYAGNLTIDNFPLAESARLGTEKYHYDFFKFRSAETLRKGAIPALHNMSTTDRASYQFNSFLQNGYISTKSVESKITSDIRKPTARMGYLTFSDMANKIFIDFSASDTKNIDHIIILGRAGGYESVLAAIPAPFIDAADGTFSFLDFQLAGIIGHVSYTILVVTNDGDIMDDSPALNIFVDNNRHIKLLFSSVT